MLQNGTVWFLVADGRNARVLVELRRGAALQELPDWKLTIAADEIAAPRDRAPRSFDSTGPARHAMDGGRDLHELAEERFLARVAALIGEAERQRQFEHLVVAAPPRALGLLRDLLPSSVRSRIRAEAAKDLLAEDAKQLRQRLIELLR